MSGEKARLIQQMQTKILGLVESPLYDYRTEHGYVPVIGEGSYDAALMFVGEAPGKNEAKTGRPFCGTAGKILDSLLDSISIPRASVYITNIVKDRPPENRDPSPAEIKVYGPFLDQQVEIIKPKVIVTLGRYSMGYIMRKFNLESELVPISQGHGKIYNAQASYGTIYIAPQYHPAAAIYNQKLKSTLVADFEVLRQFSTS